ncbi:MAG: arginine repressor [Actinobacteria bacterium]|nr:arginine repressor [Cyanobacteriota bacterium]MCL5772235.1 arginine repressor [Actinomycetota bacterium]
MSNSKRLKEIVNIINTKKISSQEMLLKELKKKGFNITQSTISRDLKDLRLVKRRNIDGEEYFVIDNNIFPEKKPLSFEKLASKLKESVISIRNTGNIIVIKTYPGEAQSVAASLDSMNYNEILGTVAGDDNIICVVDTIENTLKLMDILKNI